MTDKKLSDLTTGTVTDTALFYMTDAPGVTQNKVTGLQIKNYVGTGGGGSGTVTSVSVTTANGVSGTVANPTTTPAISLTLGAITPTSVAASGSVSGSNLSGTNTGDITLTTTGSGAASLVGQALNIPTPSTTAAAVPFSGITGSTNTTAAMVVGTGASIAPTGSGTITATTMPASGLTGTALPSGIVTSSLTTVGTIATGTWQGTVIAGQYGGTGVANTGKTITLGGNLTTSGAFATTLTSTAATNVTLPTSGTLYGTATGSITSAQLANSLTDETGSGAAVFATSPTLVTPALGTPSALVGTNITGTAAGLSIGGNAATATTATTATAANALNSATTTVNVSSATAPTTGQVLTATSSTAATWQTPSGGGTPGGTSGQMQYNNAGAFGGASWVYTATGGGFVGTTTLANGLAVGPNGSTNPTLQVDASTASAATGIQLKSAAAGGGVALNVISSGSNETLNINALGTGDINLTSGNNIVGQCGTFSSYRLKWGTSTGFLWNAFNAIWSITQSSNNASLTRWVINGANDSGASLTASTEAINWLVDMSTSSRNHATGAITQQRDNVFAGSTHTFTAASTITTGAAFAVTGAQVAGTNASITNSTAVWIQGQAVGAGVTNSYGLYVDPNTGGTNNYHGKLNGSSLGFDFNGNALVNALMPGGIVTTAFNSTSNTTLTNVTGLTANLVAGKSYSFRVYLETTANTASGIKVAMGGTATATSYRSTSIAWNTSTPTRATNSTFGASEYALTAVSATTVIIEGGFVCNTAGTLTVQFAQNVSGASASTVLVGSTLIVTRLT